MEVVNVSSLDNDGLRAAIARQASSVRSLKQGSKRADSDQELSFAIQELKRLKLTLDERNAKTEEQRGEEIRRLKALEDLLIRKMFVVPSFEIYGGVGGFYDFGPPGCAVKANLLNLWRRHFVVAEAMLEIECTNLMPEIVLKTSGHVDKFTDLMVKDEGNGECYRVDKLIEDHIDQLLNGPEGNAMSEEVRSQHCLIANKAESMEIDEIQAVVESYGIKAPGTGNALSTPRPFNLMFSCAIGPESSQVGYLRPETAQGIFINFRRLLEYNAGKLPFAVAQVGNAFRNEISPRGGLLRVREFQQAEIEHFVHPDRKVHLKFKNVREEKLVLFPKERQLSDGKTLNMSVGGAVEAGLINNETLGYYMALTAQFVRKLGIKDEGVRFRQHLDTEMAHYASDCWDLELFIGGSWVECAGHADRSCFDLQVHSKKSHVEMVGTEKYSTPQVMQVMEMNVNKGLLGKTFKKDAKSVMEALEDIRSNSSKAIAFEEQLGSEGKATLSPCCGSQFVISRDMVSFQTVTKKISEVKFVPSVIEPSFGIGRILTAVFEYCFYTRQGDEKRGVLSFPPSIAPIKVSILPLSSNSVFDPYVQELELLLTRNEIIAKVDTSSVAIGRKYARADELGIPFNLTIDFETPLTHSLTLRERDSCEQVRIPISHILSELQGLLAEKISWRSTKERFALVRSDDTKSSETTRVEVSSRGRFRRPLQDQK